MKCGSSVLVMMGLLVILIQSGCVKKVAPVTGSAGLEDGEASPFGEPEDRSVETFPDEGGIRDETIQEEEVFQAPPPEIKTERPVSVELGDIYFDFDRAALTNRSEQILRENAKTLMQHPKTKILISGHTDERGSNEYNLALGERRARTVKLFLEAFGVAPSRIEMISFGEEKPFCFESRENCYQLNRRAHFFVKPER